MNADTNNNRPMERESLVPWLISQGYDQMRARRTDITISRLIIGASTLARLKEKGSPTTKEIWIVISSSAADTVNVVEPLRIEGVMMPDWIRFGEALSSVCPSKQGYIKLLLQGIQLGEEVTDMLRPSLKAAPLIRLTLDNNALGRDGMKFAIDILKMNATLERLFIYNNVIEHEFDAASLAHTVSNHPTVNVLHVTRCGLGQNPNVMAALIPSLNHLMGISLEGNSIGSHGVKLISSWLASNPDIKFLNLRDNLLNDGDAHAISASLSKNTNLRQIYLAGNCITEEGILHAFHTSVFNLSSLNALHDSNHTCCMEFGEVVASQRYFSRVNAFPCPQLNRKIKRYVALYGNNPCLHATPVKIMPRVLAQIQGINIMDGVLHYNGLDAVFRIIRQWNMPRLFTSCIGSNRFQSSEE